MAGKPRRVGMDGNAKSIDGVLERVGASVAKLDSVGDGFPDRVVGFRGQNYLFEYKNGKKAKLRATQDTFIKTWQGAVHVVHDADEALRVLGVFT